jgi:hypothetical protein
MALSIKNDSSQPRWINYVVDGQPKRAFFNAFEERFIEELDNADQISSKRSQALRKAVELNPNSLNAALIQKKGGFVRNTSSEDRFEGFVSFINNKFTNLTLTKLRNSNPLSLFRTSEDRPQNAGTQFFNVATKKLENVSGFYSVDNQHIVSLSRGKVVYGFDFSASLTKRVLASNFYTLFRRNNLKGVSEQDIAIALINASYTGSTGTTGTTVIVTGDTGTGFSTGGTETFTGFTTYNIDCPNGQVVISGGTTAYFGQYGISYDTDPYALVGSASTITCSGGSMVVFGIANVPGNALWVSGGTVWLSGCTTGDTVFYDDCTYESFIPFTSGTTTGTTGTTIEVTGSTSGTCYTTLDLLDFLSCYGTSVAGSNSGCTIWDFNDNGNVDTGDLLTLLSNFCTSGTTG